MNKKCIEELNKLEINSYNLAYDKLCYLYDAQIKTLDQIINRCITDFTNSFSNEECDTISLVNVEALEEDEMNTLGEAIKAVNRYILNNAELSLRRIMMTFKPNRQDGLLIQKRVGLLCSRLTSCFENFLKMMISDIYDHIEFLKSYLRDSLEAYVKDLEYLISTEEYEKEFNEDLCSKYDIKKIFSYKDMESLALSKGYKYKWANGSHRIYEHEVTNKIIVIPAHDLGVGLSCKIQKQIIQGSI